MKNLKFYNISIVNHFFYVSFFALVTILYCWPILDAQRINQSDFKQFLGMSQEIFEHRAEYDEEPLWTNSMFGGMPAYQISVIYANNILVYIDKVFQLFLPRPIGILFLYFLGFYILLSSLRIQPWLSFLGALCFGLSTYFFIILEVGHNTKAHAISYMAPALSGLIYLFRKQKDNIYNKSFGFLMSFLFLGLHLRANHLQITYYLLFILFAFWINYLICSIRDNNLNRHIKLSFLFLFAGIFATAINIGSIWSTYDYSKYTIRGKSDLTSYSKNKTSGLDKDYATAYSYGKLETFNLLYPNFVGGASVGKISNDSHIFKALRKKGYSNQESNDFIQNIPLYFGPQIFTAGPVYLGAVTWILFFIGFFTLRKRIKWILLFLILFSFLLSWGKYFPLLTNFLLDHFPLYNKFRTVSMILVIAQFCVPLLAIIGLNKFFSSSFTISDRTKVLIKSTLILTTISLFFLLFGRLIFDFSSSTDVNYPKWFLDALQKDRYNIFKLDILRSLTFILITSIVLFFLHKKYDDNKKSLLLILSLLVILDMWFVNKRYFNSNDFISKTLIEEPFVEQSYDKLIKQDTTVYRVYNLNERLDQGARTSYFHHSLGGYHGAKLGRYQEIIDMHILKGNLNVINMLNTKYFISSDDKRQPIVEKNQFALGNAWFIKNINWVDNADQEIMSLNSIDPSSTVTINKIYRSNIDSIFYDRSDSINLISYAPNKLIYQSSSEKNGIAVFSEIFYPKGWQAYINGNLTTHFPVNYILRGLQIPSGKNEIIFEFKPKSYSVSSLISLFCSSILLFSILFTGALYYKQ